MKNLDVLYLTSISIEQCQPKHKRNHLKKIEKLKQSNKLNKNILIAKTIEDFTPKAKFDTFENTYFKKSQNQILFLKSLQLLSLQDQKKFIGP